VRQETAPLFNPLFPYYPYFNPIIHFIPIRTSEDNVMVLNAPSGSSETGDTPEPPPRGVPLGGARVTELEAANTALEGTVAALRRELERAHEDAQGGEVVRLTSSTLRYPMLGNKWSLNFDSVKFANRHRIFFLSQEIRRTNYKI